MAKAQNQPTSRTWSLQNGITLSVSYGKPSPPLAAIEGFLSDVLGHFKHLRDDLPQEIYRDGPPVPGHATANRRFYGNCYLEHAGDEAGDYLPTDAWVKAIAAAQAAANTVNQIAGSLDAYRAGPDGWMKEVVVLLERPGGDLDAFDVVLKRAQ